MTTARQRDTAAAVDRRYAELWTQAMRSPYSMGLAEGEMRARLRARAEREVTATIEADLDRVFRAAVAPIMPAVDRHDSAALTEYLECLAHRWDTTIIWQRPSVFPAGAAAFAEWQHRRITLPIIESGHEDRFAVGLHEQGHINMGPCNGPDHFVDPGTKKFHRCLACETSAWRVALRLAPASCLDLVHARLREGLEIYRESTPGPRDAFRALEDLRDGSALAAERQKRAEGLDYYRRKHELKLLSGQERTDRQAAEQREIVRASRARRRESNYAV